MVGIVIVSHSHGIAEGAAGLAREMGGSDVKIETAGGLDMPDHPIGTDAVLVMQAIERAWSEDGVLVLMDLGSAVLSAEMALELLPEEVRSSALLCDAPLVEGAVAAAVTAKLGMTLEQVAAEARGALAAKATHLGTEGAPETIVVEDAKVAAGEVLTLQLVVGNPHGLHARPAARFVQTASAFDADVRVSNVTRGRGPVTARSLNAVATLGVVEGDEIEVLAAGPQAEDAVAAIRALAGRGFDDEPVPGAPPGPTPVVAGAVERGPAPTGPPEPGSAIPGLPASPGVALGEIRRFHVPELAVPAASGAADAEVELATLDRALAATRTDIEAQRAAIAGRAGEYQAAIFDAHALFLQDEMLLEPVRAAISDEHVTAAAAWNDVVERMAEEWDALDDEYLRARAADLRSVGTQVLAHILGVELPRPRLDAPGILVAADLTPADTAGLDTDLVLAVATAFGGPTSHSAVLARSLGIPAVVGLGESLLSLPEGSHLAVDGDAGVVHVEPSEELAAEFEDRRRAEEEADREARMAASAPARTADGVLIEVAANIGAPEDVPTAVAAGADAVGLFRTEFLFMGREAMPDEDEQESAYREAAEALQGRSMLVRTLDVGADKPLPYLAQPAEANPFLGVRGLRLALERPDLLGAQLRAVLRVAVDHPVRVMFPMVATLQELRAGRAAVNDAREALARRGERVPDTLEVGVMIEVPAAALSARLLAAEADFFSVGTNDLTQYTLAADRGNERVASLADALHPSVLQLIGLTVEAAQTHERWVGVCGELAGDPIATPILLGLGVRELSMSAPAIPRIKQVVRTVDRARARALAEAALRMESAAAVRELVRGRS